MRQTGQDTRRRRSKRREPLRIDMTLVIKTGDAPEDRITLMRDRDLRMVGSVFEYRDRIRRFLTQALLRVAASSPAFYRELLPGIMTAVRGRRGREEAD